MTQSNYGGARRLRIGIMGEFSAGKSTLCNLLLGGATLPAQVTATRLAPVWLTQGPGTDVRVKTDGTEQEIELDRISDIPVEDTSCIRLHHDAPLLESCDIVDFPGISDPNMDPVVWQRVLSEIDVVLWLTHATQAWRQTEAAAWASVPEKVRARSALLLTRFDKIVSERDKSRVMSRVTKETSGLFTKVLPVSLLQAARAGDDQEAWAQSGAGAVLDYLAGAMVETALPSPVGTGPKDAVTAATKRPAAAASETCDNQAPRDAVGGFSRIMPRRIKPSGFARRPRPEATLEPLHTVTLGF